MCSSIVDGPEDVESKDDKASDVLEEMAILVPAPTKSLRPAWGKVSNFNSNSYTN